MAAEAQAPLGDTELLIVLEPQWPVFGFLEEAKPTEGSSLEKHDMKTKIPQNPAARKNLRRGCAGFHPSWQIKKSSSFSAFITGCYPPAGFYQEELSVEDKTCTSQEFKKKNLKKENQQRSFHLSILSNTLPCQETLIQVYSFRSGY